MKLLALFLCSLTWSACKGTALQTEVFPMRSGVTSCVGDTVTFTCTVVGVAHRWQISSISGSASLFVNDLTNPIGPYQIQRISVNNNMVTGSRLSVISSQDLNGENITCEVGGQGEAQDTIVMVFGPPSAPGLNVTAGIDLRSFVFNITPPTPSECVVNYIITSPGVYNMTFMPNQTSPLSSPDFDLCANIYNFTVMAVTADNRSTSSVVFLDQEDFDFSGASVIDLRRDMSIGGITWSTNVPSSCFFGYVVSLTNNPTVSITVNDTRISFQMLIDGGFSACISQRITVTPMEIFNEEPLDTGSASMEVFINDQSECPTTMATPETTTASTPETTTPATGDTGSIIGPAVGGVCAGIAVVAVIIIIVVILVYVKKKGGSDKDDVKVVCTSSKEPSYHSSGAPPPHTSIPLSDAGAAGAMYASPDEIKHEAAGPTGDEYALVTSNTKKKSRQPAPAADTPDVGDMYSVPDKTKKKENQGVSYLQSDRSS